MKLSFHQSKICLRKKLLQSSVVNSEFHGNIVYEYLGIFQQAETKDLRGIEYKLTGFQQKSPSYMKGFLYQTEVFF
jgi:hypothetical protein